MYLMSPMRWGMTGMARTRVLVVASVLALSVGIAQAQNEDAAPPPPAPHLQIEKSEIHLGSIPRGEVAEVLFVLQNTGDADLRILHVKPG